MTDEEIREYQICTCGHERGLHDEAGVCTKQEYPRRLCTCKRFESGEESDGMG